MTDPLFHNKSTCSSLHLVDDVGEKKSILQMQFAHFHLQTWLFIGRGLSGFLGGSLPRGGRASNRRLLQWKSKSAGSSAGFGANHSQRKGRVSEFNALSVLNYRLFSAKLLSRKTPPRSFYLDLNFLANYWHCPLKEGQNEARLYHHTAPTALIYALREGLAELAEEGLQNRQMRHQRAAETLWKGKTFVV